MEAASTGWQAETGRGRGGRAPQGHRDSFGEQTKEETEKSDPIYYSAEDGDKRLSLVRLNKEHAATTSPNYWVLILGASLGLVRGGFQVRGYFLQKTDLLAGRHYLRNYQLSPNKRTACFCMLSQNNGSSQAFRSPAKRAKFFVETSGTC